MLYFTQLIYIKEGANDSFEQFETVAIPLIAKYNGQLLLRVRPDAAQYIEQQMDPPYEIHFGSFNSEADFSAFMKDETRQQFLHLKDQSIRNSLIVLGSRL
ncbi:MAG: DUF1330 domain-containing protein [Bacteroidota bacterium]|nr:DUF1330 domain-containing protein [Bacteroidota bacterium]